MPTIVEIVRFPIPLTVASIRPIAFKSDTANLHLVQIHFSFNWGGGGYPKVGNGFP